MQLLPTLNNNIDNVIYHGGLKVEEKEIIASDDVAENVETLNFEADETLETVQSEEKLSLEDIKDAVENGDYSLVDPDFKAMMDAYESFCNEYIEFMEKYSSEDADMMSMLGDYTDMTAKMADWSEKIDEVDSDSLSPADNAYYLLVTLRVEGKLLKYSFGF